MDAKPLIYVAGPITGDPHGCVRNAVATFEPLRAWGAVPFFPQLSVLHEMIAPQDYETWMAYDFDVIRRCDALLRLPGESAGADREVEHADRLHLAVFHWGEPAARRALARWIDEWTLAQRMRHEIGGAA